MKQLGVLLISPGWDASPSQGTQHEVTRNITTLPCMGCYTVVHHRKPSMKQQGVLLLSLEGILVHHRVPSMKQLGVLLLPPGWDTIPSKGTQHETTRSGLSLDGLLVHCRVPKIVPIYTVHQGAGCQRQQKVKVTVQIKCCCCCCCC